MDPLSAARLGLGAGVLLVAARYDLRTRRVSDSLWLVLGTAGLVLLSLELFASTSRFERLGLVPATAILFYAVFLGEPLFDETGFHPRPARIGAFGIAAALLAGSAVLAFRDGGPASGFVELLTMPVMVLLYQGFYQIGLIHGGADAKAMIALTLLVPTYPDVSPLPVIQTDARLASLLPIVFPFSLVIFVDAAVLYLAVPLTFLVYNGLRGDLAIPQALFGYRADLKDLPKNTWLMERIDESGEHVLVLLPRRGRDTAIEARKLLDAGHSRAWVQPKVPFMVPLVAGFLAAFLLGNVLGLLFPR